jgi:hypothetical protein
MMGIEENNGRGGGIFSVESPVDDQLPELEGG